MSAHDPFRFIRQADLRQLLEAARPKLSEVDERLALAHARRGVRRNAQSPRSDGPVARRERRAVENEVARERADATRALLVTFRRYVAEETVLREHGDLDLSHCSTVPEDLVQFVAGVGLHVLSAIDPERALREFLNPPIRGPRPDDARREKLAAGAARLERYGADLDDAFHRASRVFGVGEETIRAAYYEWPLQARLLRRPI